MEEGPTTEKKDASLRVLYLFCGVPRQADINSCLKTLSNKESFTLELKEVDIERSSADDLSSESLWEQLMCEVRDGLWDVVILSPPCNTYSRARCQWRSHPGPRPLRSKAFPWGFPWLSNSHYKLVQQHNYFVRQCVKMCKVTIQTRSFFLLEHPEDLGAVGEEIPASIWQLEEIRDLQLEAKATTWAIYQCHFGAESPKPTRFLSNLPGCKSFPHAAWPYFDSKHRYQGPLPFSCSHKKHVKKLIGKSSKGGFRTSPSASYPAALCKHLSMLVTGALRKGATEHWRNRKRPVSDEQPSAEVSKDKSASAVVSKENSVSVEATTVEGTGLASSTSTAAKAVEHGQAQQQRLEDESDDYVGNSKSWGLPIMAEWDSSEKYLVDGLGLCSPNRWPPLARGANLGTEAKHLAEELHNRTRAWVLKHVLDTRREAISLALGRTKQSPFSEVQLDELRRSWAEVLPMPKQALEKASGQPFYLSLLSQGLRILEDPDWEILTSPADGFEVGVPVGYKSPLPRTPEVFPPKRKQRTLDESQFMEEARNYKSAVEHAEKLEEKFREDEKKGMMFCSTIGVLKKKYPDQPILIAAMGAIEKPDGGVRPLHDGTHYVQVNNNIKFQDQLQYPGPQDAAALLRETSESRESYFVLGADISAAHRLVKIREADWHLLGCKSDSDAQTIWINKVGTFGVSSAAYWWTRLFGCVGRFVSRLLLQMAVLQLIYVDDLQLVTLGKDKFVALWMALASYEALGTPFAYHKFGGGLQSEFVGYWLDFEHCKLGISERRGRWLLAFLVEMEKSGYTVSMRRFSEFLGRLGFAARVLVWLKPHLAPLYSWTAALDRSTVATAPRLVKLVLFFLKRQFEGSGFLFSAQRPLHTGKELFRTDAKCADRLVVLGGVELDTGRWFSLRLEPSQAPFLFKPNGESQWASAPAELLATLAALVAFDHLTESSRRRELGITLVAGTDNQSNEALMVRASATRWPLLLVNMQLSEKLMTAGVKLVLRWRPRDQNVLADELTNEIFENVEAEKRVPLTLEDLKLDWLFELWRQRDDFLDRETWKFYQAPTDAQSTAKSKW